MPSPPIPTTPIPILSLAEVVIGSSIRFQGPGGRLYAGVVIGIDAPTGEILIHFVSKRQRTNTVSRKYSACFKA